jgi:hypothetical protein
MSSALKPPTKLPVVTRPTILSLRYGISRQHRDYDREKEQPEDTLHDHPLKAM